MRAKRREPLTDAEVAEVQERVERFIKRLDRIITHAERLEKKRLLMSERGAHAATNIRKTRKKAP
jgi:hypothetical protein